MFHRFTTGTYLTTYFFSDIKNVQVGYGSVIQDYEAPDLGPKKYLRI